MQLYDNHIISIIDMKLIYIDMKNTNSPRDKWAKVMYKGIFLNNKNTTNVLNENKFSFTEN